MSNRHVCEPGTARSAGDEYTCACGRRWIAVRQRWWSRTLHWERVVFSLPRGASSDSTVTRPSPRERA